VEHVLGLLMKGDTTPVQRGASAQSDPLAEVLSAARAGDARATRRLLQALGPRLLRVVRGVLGAGHPDVEDVLQDATLLVLRALEAFRGDGELEGYAVRITLRAAIAARKKHRARAEAAEPDPADAQDATATDESLARRRRAILRGLLERLPEAQAEALVMRVILGYSLEECARIAGVPENTVRSRVRLAREALRTEIESDPVLLDSLEIHP
jgi:RNA polymerase sigma-70 factor (ECF subfamily)